MLKRILAASLMLGGMAFAVSAQDTLVLGLQESGTALWEIEAIRNLGLDEKHGVTLEIRPLADSRAGQIALQAGAVDIILSDFTWVSAQRHLGSDFTMVPHSLAVGGLIVPADSEIQAIEDLAGKTIGVAGGPVDKSFVVLRAYYSALTDEALTEVAEIRFGAPPLINELLASGGVDAGLNFWHWNARAEAEGMREVISVAEMFQGLGLSEPPPLLGWTFSEAVVGAKREALVSFLDASFEAKAALLSDDAVWDDLAVPMAAEDNSVLFTHLRDGYRAGIVESYDPNDTLLAELAFGLLAEFGGPDVVGEQTELAAGTFWEGYSK